MLFGFNLGFGESVMCGIHFPPLPPPPPPSVPRVFFRVGGGGGGIEVFQWTSYYYCYFLLSYRSVHHDLNQNPNNLKRAISNNFP